MGFVGRLLVQLVDTCVRRQLCLYSFVIRILVFFVFKESFSIYELFFGSSQIFFCRLNNIISFVFIVVFVLIFVIIVIIFAEYTCSLLVIAIKEILSVITILESLHKLLVDSWCSKESRGHLTAVFLEVLKHESLCLGIYFSCLSKTMSLLESLHCVLSQWTVEATN